MNSSAFMSWSGGKDSALALYIAKQHGTNVGALVTSVNAGTGRISMHGVQQSLLQAQASAMGTLLHTIVLPEMPGMSAYEAAVRSKHQQLKEEGYTQAIFGDIFLEDLKAYRETLLGKDDLQCIFPLWGMDSRKLVELFISDGFKAVIVCVNSSLLDRSFCGRLLDESFLADLPSHIDPAGENGEYHSFVFDGPLFSSPVAVEKGELVFREYAAPKHDDCFTTPQQALGFYFQDLLLV